MPVPKHRPVVTTTGSMPSCWIASYMAMQLCTVMIEMNTSAVPAPAAVIAAWMSAEVAPGSVTSTAVTGIPAASNTGLSSEPYAAWPAGLSA